MIGDKNTPVGTKFDIIAVLADQKAQDEVTTYYETCEKNKDWSTGMYRIPTSAKEYDNITVTRT